MSGELQKIEQGNTGIIKSVSRYEHQDLCPALNPEQKDMLLATNGQRINSFTIPELMKPIKDCILSAVYDLGHKNTFGDKNSTEEQKDMEALIMVQRIIEKIQSITYKNKSLTLEDVQIAIEKGAKGEYTYKDEVTMVSPNHVYTWVKRYLNEKAELNKIQRNHEIKLEKDKQPKPTPEELKKRIIQTTIEAYEDYQKKGRYYDMGSLLYDFLTEHKIINLTEDQKEIIRQQAKKQLEREAKNAKESAMNMIQRNEIQKTIEALGRRSNP